MNFEFFLVAPNDGLIFVWKTSSGPLCYDVGWPSWEGVGLMRELPEFEPRNGRILPRPFEYLRPSWLDGSSSFRELIPIP